MNTIIFFFTIALGVLKAGEISLSKLDILDIGHRL